MRCMEIAIRKRDILWNYVAVIISLVSNVIILPFLVCYLDENTLGLWYVFQSIGGITVLFDFGFNATFARNITYCWSGARSLSWENLNNGTGEKREPDFYMMKKILRTCRIVYLLVSLCALVLMLTAGTAYILHLAKDISGSQYFIAWIVFSVAVFLNLYYGYYASFLRGVGAIAEVSKATIIAKTAQILMTGILLITGFGIIGACSAYLVYGFLFRWISRRLFLRYQRIGERLNQVEGKPTGEEIRSLFGIVWKNAWREGVVSLSSYLNTQASTLICSAFLPLSQTGTYSLAVQLSNVIATIASALYSAYQPVLQRAYVLKDAEKTRDTMSLIIVSYTCLFVLGTLLMVFLGLPLIRLIKPEVVVGVGVYCAISLYQFVLVFRNCYLSYFSCTNRVIYYKAMLITSIASVVLSTAMMGLVNANIRSLIVGQLICQLVFNAWHWPLKANREMQLTLCNMAVRAVQVVRSMLYSQKSKV